jgi:hypothetical protein
MKIRNGKIAPSGFLHKQLDITDLDRGHQLLAMLIRNIETGPDVSDRADHEVYLYDERSPASAPC